MSQWCNPVELWMELVVATEVWCLLVAEKYDNYCTILSHDWNAFRLQCRSFKVVLPSVLPNQGKFFWNPPNGLTRCKALWRREKICKLQCHLGSCRDLAEALSLRRLSILLLPILLLSRERYVKLSLGKHFYFLLSSFYVWLIQFAQRVNRSAFRALWLATQTPQILCSKSPSKTEWLPFLVKCKKKIFFP